MFMERATDKEAACVAALQKSFPPSTLDADDVSFLSDSTYLRFARARNGDVAKASEMLKNAIAWRKEARPYAITGDDMCSSARHIEISCGGFDRDGCPVIALSVVDPDGLTMETRKKFLMYILEETARKGYERVTWVFTWGHMAKEKEKREDKEPNAKQHRKEAMQIMLDYYPERMNGVLLFHPPFLIRLMLPFMKMSINSETSAKIRNIGSNVKDFDKYIARDQLPALCGGGRADVKVEHFGALPPATQATK